MKYANEQARASEKAVTQYNEKISDLSTELENLQLQFEPEDGAFAD